MEDTRSYNRKIWDRMVDQGNRWTIPVTSKEIAEARLGNWALILTPSKPVPRNWYPELKGREVLCLAGGGGQQGPILAAVGANVTVFDNSPKQLKRDREVAEREGLEISTVEGDMRSLDAFADESFDLIFHPCSNSFVENIQPVWDECYRVSKKGGILLAGFSNPVSCLFDPAMEKQGIFQLRFSAPYSDLSSVTEEERKKYFPDEPLFFGHTFEEQLGGQTRAGFHIVGLYEDDWGGTQPLDRFFKGFMATRALKL